MKRILITLILLIFYKLNYAQQTILVTKNREGTYEEYSVLQSNKKIKHGSYVKLSTPPIGLYADYSIESIGAYSNGLKNGYWETYYGNTNNIKDKGFYKNDLRDSIWAFFYPEGVRRKLAKIQSDESASLQVVGANPIILKTGKYKNGEPSGIWEYFDQKGVLSQEYDHDNDSLIFLSNVDTKNFDAGFIGGELLLTQYLYEIFDFHGLMKTVNTKIDLQSSKIVFKFSIDEKGSVGEITTLENTVGNKKIYTRAIETIQSLNKKWYPGIKNGTPQGTTKTITFTLAVDSSFKATVSQESMSSSMSKDFNLNIKVE